MYCYQVSTRPVKVFIIAHRASNCSLLDKFLFWFLCKQVDDMLNILGHSGSSSASVLSETTVEDNQIRNPDVCQEEYSASNPRGRPTYIHVHVDTVTFLSAAHGLMGA